MSQEISPSTVHYIDKAQFERLNGTFAIFPAVARIFSQFLPSWLEDVQRGMDANHLEDLADKLHKMKGCCGMMGAYALAQEIAVLEKHIAQSGLHENKNGVCELLRKVQNMDAEVRLLAQS